jgi:hypothetical protein
VKDPAIRPDKPDIEGESSFHLLVETSQGLFRRTITRIRSGESLIHGRDVESLTKTLATAWGLPDFIFAPIVVRKGGAQREIGDAFILIGDLGACLQIKSRKESSADPEREKAWLTKNINKANKQLVGSLKALRGYQKILLRNSRNLEISITPNEIHWISVVVVDHPGLEEYFPEVVSIVLTLTDWHFLFEQLKSTYAVLQYLVDANPK